MRGKAGLLQGYNGQTAVNSKQVIVGQHLSQKPTDITLTHVVLDEVRAQLAAAGLDPGALTTVLADAGYASEDAFLRAEQAGLQLLAPIISDEKRALGEDPGGGRDLSKLPATGRAQAKLRTPEGRDCYKLRGRTVEPVFGQIKDRLNLRTFPPRAGRLPRRMVIRRHRPQHSQAPQPSLPTPAIGARARGAQTGPARPEKRSRTPPEASHPG
jgi:Transposase DDE domain